MKKFLLIAVLALLVAVPSMQATDLLLCISDSGFGCFSGSANTFSIFWNGSGAPVTSALGTASGTATLTDSNALTFIGSVGSFTFNVTTGIYNPSPGVATDLNTVNINSDGAGTLYLVFGADNFTSGAPFAIESGGTMSGGVTSVTETACYEPGSGAFYICGLGPAPIFATATATGPGSFTLNAGGSLLNPTNPFGLETDLAIVFSGAGTFSGDFALTSVPEPATLAMLGSGLLGFAAWGRRKLGRP